MKARSRRSRALLAVTAALGTAGVSGVAAVATSPPAKAASTAAAASQHGASLVLVSRNRQTTTPIKHVVVIFQENVSFDRYFGTYPSAANTDGEPFYARPDTPNVNGLTPSLLTDNPNGVNPRRLDPDNINDLLTCDQNHDYTPEQFAENGGAMNQFTSAGGTATTTGTSPTGVDCQASDVMNYYDGNTATAMWNYANHFAMSDNFYGTTFGPSAPGAVNLVSGDTGGVDVDHAVRGALTPSDGDVVGDGNGGDTLIGDAQPYWDDCSSRDALALTGQNIGDLLNEAGLSWGWFEGGFEANTAYSGPADTASTYNQLNEPGRATCTTTHNVGAALGGTGKTGVNAWGTKADYIPHHEPFQFYASTANPHHLDPTSIDAVGTDTATPGEFNTANHNYDTSWFNTLVSDIKAKSVPASHFPAVSFLKAPGYEDAHADYSDPIDEQNFVVNEVNAIESLPTWKSTAIFITYDDSDGFYDHQYGGVSNPSSTSADVLTGAGSCGTGTPIEGEQGRCGPGPRLPLIVISPYAKADYVSNVQTDQSSILQFIADNWQLGQIAGSAANVAGSLDDLFNFSQTRLRPLQLSPTFGEPLTPVEGQLSAASGPDSGGSTITIDGINLDDTTAIMFGSTPTKQFLCSSNSTFGIADVDGGATPASVCTVKVPAAASSGPVAITMKVGKVTAADDAGDYTYTG